MVGNTSLSVSEEQPNPRSSWRFDFERTRDQGSLSAREFHECWNTRRLWPPEGVPVGAVGIGAASVVAADVGASAY